MRPQPFQKPSLYDANGRRKYLNAAERKRFIAAALQQQRVEIRALCLVLAHTGCRISEALSLTTDSLQVEEGVIAIRCLKKRKGNVVIRQVPVPEFLLHELAQLPPTGFRLWRLSRTRAWQLVKAVIQEANVSPGPHATPKGLRHAFGLNAIQAGVPLNLVQRWLGHASMSTTAIYLDAVGPEEWQIAARMWSV